MVDHILEHTLGRVSQGRPVTRQVVLSHHQFYLFLDQHVQVVDVEDCALAALFVQVLLQEETVLGRGVTLLVDEKEGLFDEGCSELGLLTFQDQPAE